MKSPTLLCILDGFGLNPNPQANAIAAAKKPNFDKIWQSCPHTKLTTFGERVGLPAGQMGNSEVGHLNIGAGRIVEQWLLRITKALKSDFLQHSAEFKAFQENLQSAPALHLIGLASDGGVHSHIEHLKLLISKLSTYYNGKIYLHLITDGRDTAPQSAKKYLRDLTDFITHYQHCQISTICGRFFAMDRDQRWDRVQRALDLILSGKATRMQPLEEIEANYAKGISDEFIEPASFNNYPGAQAKDCVLFWNFREDRMRQLVAALTEVNFSSTQPSSAVRFTAANRVLCFTEYDHNLKLPYLFKPLEINNHLGQYLANLGLKQLRVAETEKYPHVTYFFNAGIEQAFQNEDRKLVPSPRDVKTYDLKPAMSAVEVTDTVIAGIESGSYDLIVVNLANCDMVGHTGVFEAAKSAVETVDMCLGKMLSALQKKSGQALIIADHGNAEQMQDYLTGEPHTAHTTYPVPCILFGNNKVNTLSPDGALCDVAPTILKLMGLKQPQEMTGNSLF